MISASIGGCQNGFVATLSNGRHLKAADLRALASELHGLRVTADRLSFEWNAGQRMLTAGQQVALYAELRGREGDLSELPICA